jgi:putative ABC transport system permease protein
VNLALAMTLARGGFGANRLRLALTIACIALGVALATGVHTIHTSALAEIARAASALTGKADLEIRGPRNGFDDAVFANVAMHPSVQAASPIVEVEAALVGGDDVLRIIGIDPLRAVQLQPAFLAPGRTVAVGEAAGLLDARNAWLTPAAAARLKLAHGDTFRTMGGDTEVEWSVAGILDDLADAGDIAIVDIAAAQWRLGRLGRLSRIEVRLERGTEEAAFARAMANILPAGVVVAPARSIGARAEALTRAYRVNLDALALIALATGAFLVFSTLALQAARRRQEFALLRAIGVTRRGLWAVLAFEGALVGIAGAIAGSVVGVVASRLLLERFGSDLGAGFFAGRSLFFAIDPLALAAIGGLGVATAVAGALWVGSAVARIPVAEALRDRSLDLPLAHSRAAWLAFALAVGAIPLLFAPPVAALPLGGYAAITLWLAAAVIAVDPLCRWVLRLMPPGSRPVAQLASAQVRHLPGHLSASVAGIVMSTSLCVAMAIMVFSFRVSLDDWLRGVVGADVYVRAGANGDTGFFTPEDEARIAALPQMERLESLRYDRLALDATGPPVSVVARPIDERILRGFRATNTATASTAGETRVWISEAARDLQGWREGERIRLPLEGKAFEVRVAGIIRDYARTWGAVLIDIRDYRRLTGDTRVNDFAIHLARGADAAAATAAIRAAFPQARGLRIEDAAEIHRRSLEIFDRSFAVTYALEAIAIAIGLAGVTSSFAALAWSRRREFGVLRFLGLRRGEILRILALEGAMTGALGAAIGLVTGIAISLVLVQVVNRQSFHWTLEIHWPVAGIAALLAAVIALCAIGARASAAFAVRHEAVLAVKDDA